MPIIRWSETLTATSGCRPKLGVALPGANSKFKDSDLIDLSPSGDVLSRISLSDMLVRNGYRHLLYRAERYDHDPLHIDDVQPVLRDGPFWRRGDLFVSLRINSVIFLYQPATDEVVWLESGPWLHQHDVDIVSEHEISVFSNNTVATGDGASGRWVPTKSTSTILLRAKRSRRGGKLCSSTKCGLRPGAGPSCPTTAE